MAKVEQAVTLVTDPANVSEIPAVKGERRFAVNQARVIRGLRAAGAGKAEARELALKALEQAGGGAEQRVGRGAGVAGNRGETMLEDWWVPVGAVRFGDG